MTVLQRMLVVQMIVLGLMACRASGGPAEEAWRGAEKGFLQDHVQLTFGDRFVKAGESYFSPDDSKIIFQAVERPEAGSEADDFYAMFVADVVREAAVGNPTTAVSKDSKAASREPRSNNDQIKGLANIRRISPKGSANTCGWFHPIEPNVVIFASTIGPPSESHPPGYRGGSDKRYRWSFPKEMRIVRCDLTKADGTAATLQEVGGYSGVYQAEGSLSNDGRHLLYCSLESNLGDLFVLDLKTHRKTCVVQAKGYDGGPFFSPDGKRICYRSDRLGDNMLQLFVADLAFNDVGEVVGIRREYQLTDDPWVNWCPFWTRDGRRLIYSSSELGERNFEIFLIDADPGDLPGSTGTIKYGTAKRRLTRFEPATGPGAPAASDVLPALSSDGRWMIWASRRGPQGDVQLWAARLTLNPDAPWKSDPATLAAPKKRTTDNQITITDPESGRIFIYDVQTHKLSEYHMNTHTLSEVTDLALIKHVMHLYESQPEPD
jgi:TolB protein